MKKRSASTMVFVALVALNGSIDARTTAEHRPASDDWENPEEQPVTIEACDAIADPLVRPVVSEMRVQSIARLAKTSATELEDGEAGSLTGILHRNDSVSASSLVAFHSKSLRKQKNAAFA